MTGAGALLGLCSTSGASASAGHRVAVAVRLAGRCRLPLAAAPAAGAAACALRGGSAAVSPSAVLRLGLGAPSKASCLRRLGSRRQPACGYATAARRRLLGGSASALGRRRRPACAASSPAEPAAARLARRARRLGGLDLGLLGLGSPRSTLRLDRPRPLSSTSRPLASAALAVGRFARVGLSASASAVIGARPSSGAGQHGVGDALQSRRRS